MSLPQRLGPLPLAIAFAAGLVLAGALDRAGIDPWLRWGLAATLATWARRHPAVLVAAVIAAGSARGARPNVPLPAGVIADDRRVDRVVGIVEGPVVRTATGAGATLDLAPGEIWVWSEHALVPGEQIAVTGLVRSARGVRGPAQPAREGLEITAQTVTVLGDPGGMRARIWRWAEATQQRWSEAIDAAGGDPAGRAALRGIAVGDRSAVPEALDDRWRVLGIFHVLSVSGLHLAVIAGLAFAVLRRLIAASPWGGRVHPARWAGPPALVLALAYTLVTGAQLATLRALIVVALMIAGAMLDRPMRLVDALGVAALLVLAWHPADLADPSFQLSFTAALTLALRPRTRLPGVRGWLVGGATASMWITVTTAPITAYHFQQLSVGGILGNLVLTPLLELFALPLALAGIALGALGGTLIWLATLLVTLIDRVGALLAAHMPVGHIAVASLGGVAVLVALSLWLATRGTRTRLDVIGWIALCAAWWLARDPAPPQALRVTFLDVGQGDAALIELPDGAVWLVDAGGIASAHGPAASSTGVVIDRALAVFEHDAIDLAIISHPHPDHYLGLLGIAAPIHELWSAAEPEAPVRRDPTVRGQPTAFARVTDVLVARGTRLEHPPLGLARREAGVELFVWGPRFEVAEGARVIEAADPVRTVNDNSLVIELRFRGRRILFVGDIEAEGEHLLVAAGLSHVDVVKVPHHGSPTSSSPAFVEAAAAELAVISCGRGNTFGFPAADVIARWRAAGTDVARTDLEGAITVVVDDEGALSASRFVRPAP